MRYLLYNLLHKYPRKWSIEGGFLDFAVILIIWNKALLESTIVWIIGWRIEVVDLSQTS